METTSHKFQLGHFNCLAIADGTHIYNDPAELLFPDAPKDLLAEALRQNGIELEHWNEWCSDYTCLIVDTKTHCVLIDTGAGSSLPSAGRLVKNMQANGIDPGEIDIVLISHAHPDHLGAANFPNARIIMRREEWTFWNSEPDLPRMPTESRDILIGLVKPLLLPLADRIELIDKNTEIVPGIKTMEASGHTPGHMAISITSGGRELLCTGDAILHPVHIEHPDWNAVVDVLPEDAQETRRLLLARAVSKNSILFCFHFPFPGMGRVTEKGETWQWEP